MAPCIGNPKGLVYRIHPRARNNWVPDCDMTFSLSDELSVTADLLSYTMENGQSEF